MGPVKGGVHGAFESFQAAQMTGSHGGSISTGPILRDFEAAARDARHHAKSVDDVLHLVRQQVFAFRRWMLSTEPENLHNMIRAYIYVSTYQMSVYNISALAYQNLLDMTFKLKDRDTVLS